MNCSYPAIMIAGEILHMINGKNYWWLWEDYCHLEAGSKAIELAFKNAIFSKYFALYTHALILIKIFLTLSTIEIEIEMIKIYIIRRKCEYNECHTRGVGKMWLTVDTKNNGV